MAVKLSHPIHVPFAITQVAVLAADSDAAEAATLTGYAEERLREADFQPVPYDRAILENLHSALRRVLSETELRQLFAAGGALSEGEAIARTIALAQSF